MTEAPFPAVTDQDEVAIVVLNHNGRDLLLGCLEAIGRLHWRHLLVLVVDNGSSDGSAAAVERAFPTVPLLRQARNLGVSGGRNAGLSWVSAHGRLEPNSIGAFVVAARSGRDIAIVAGKAYRRPGEMTLISAGGMRFNPYLGAAWDVGSEEPDTGRYDRPHDIQACPGFAFFVRTAVFERIGGFDENLNPYGWEDVEFSLRARAAGYRLVYTPDAVVYHLGGRAGRGPIDRYERHKVRNMLRVLRRHATWPQLACFALLLPARAAYRVGRELAGGNWRVVLAWASPRHS